MHRHPPHPPDSQPRRIEAWSLLLRAATSLGWLVVALVVIAGIWLTCARRDIRQTPGPEPMPAAQATVHVIPWDEIDEEVARAMQQARAQAEAHVTAELDQWATETMDHVDQDFLPWFFNYFVQQELLLHYAHEKALHALFPSRPTAENVLQQRLQREIMQRVMHPEIGGARMERIGRETLDIYGSVLLQDMDQIPVRYNVPALAWDEYTTRLGLVVRDVDGNRGIPVLCKLAAVPLGLGTVISIEVAAHVLRRLVQRWTGRIAGKTGAKLLGKLAGRMLGPAIIAIVIGWDLLDHHITVTRARPIVRRNLEEYINEIRADMLTHIMAPIDELEFEITRRLAERKAEESGQEE